MKTFLTNPVLRSVTVSALFGSLAVASPSLYAQTFAGRDFLAESPVSIQAFICPDAHKTALDIHMENRTSDAVRVRIVDEDQKTVYAYYVATPTYYGRLNLSALPYGTYTIELSNRNARHMQSFRIERSLAGHVVMVAQQPDSLLAQNPLVVKIVP